MMDLGALRSSIVNVFASDGLRELPKDEYSTGKYPKLLPVMHFVIDRYRLEGFGHLMTMHTTSKVGMELLTAALMPYEGSDVPFMLLDIMQMNKRIIVFVEYYDCTADHPAQPLLQAVADKYAALNAYDEKPAWYVKERAPYSLIKEGTPDDAKLMQECVLVSVTSYREVMREAKKNPANLAGLEVFRERMIKEGNPSSEILNKVLGKEGAATFFRKCVMPLNDKGE